MIHIIGAGPAGLFLGQKLKELDSKLAVTIYEEHKKIGEPVQCTGLLTNRVEKYVKIHKNVIANKIKVSRIYAPNKKFVEIKLKDPDLVIFRDKFDQQLAKQAEKAGCKILLGHGLKDLGKTELIFADKKVKIKKNDIIVGADGPRSKVAKACDVKVECLQGMQAVMEIKNDNVIKFYPGTGLYAWFVPENKNRARIGVAGSKKDYDSFIRMFKGKILEVQAGMIPLYSPTRFVHIAERNVFFVGDAAGQVKNTTGGGIVPGLESAEVLAKAIVNGEYWKYRLYHATHPNLIVHYMMHKTFKKFDDADWNKLIKDFSSKDMKEALANTDRDDAFSLGLKILIKKPGLLGYATRLL